MEYFWSLANSVLASWVMISGDCASMGAISCGVAFAVMPFA